MSNSKFPIYKILILVTILAVPGFLYYLLQAKGKNRYKPLPIFGPKAIASTFKMKRGKKIADTTYHIVPAISYVSVNGKSKNLGDYKNQLVVIQFFNTADKHNLSLANQQVKRLVDDWKDNKMVSILSINVSESQDQNHLKKYFAETNPIQGKWDIVNSDTSKIYPWARQQLFVNASFDANNNNVIYTDQLILLDAERRIRGYYKATSAEEVNRLSDEMKVLIAEELRKIKAEF